MNEFLSSPLLIDLSAYAIRLALAGVCICTILLIAARLLRRRAEPQQYGVLFGGVVGLLAIPALVGLGQCLSLPAAPPEDEVLRVPLATLTDLLNRPAIEEPQEAEAPSLAEPLILSALGLLWAFGSAFGLARLALAFRKQRRSFIRQPWAASFWNAEAKARLAQQVGLQRFPDVDVSPAVPMPMVIGIWRPTIVLPASAPDSWGQAQWEAVLLHEAAHVARGDHWAALAQRLAVLLFWWCPLVYPLSRRLNELRENICDDYALEGPCDQIAYAELLVESAERLVNRKTVPVSLALLDSAHGGLEARITRLLAKEKRTMTKLSRTGKLLGVACLAAAGLMTMAATAFSGGTQPTPQKKVQIKIIIDGKEIDIHDAKLLELLQPAPKKKEAAKPKESVFEIELNELHFQIEPKKDAAKPAPKTGVGRIQINEGNFSLPLFVAPQAKPTQADPRIEALVKQAEAIKPGSGAEIRKALQGAPKHGEVRSIAITGDGKMIWNLTPELKKPAVPAKKGIIIQIEGAKAKPATELDLKKLLEKGLLHFELQLQNPVPAAEAKPAAKAKSAAKKEQAGFRIELVPATPKVAQPKIKKEEAQLFFQFKAANPKTPPAADIDALRRQLDRISADLQDLRKRLGADGGGKK